MVLIRRCLELYLIFALLLRNNFVPGRIVRICVTGAVLLNKCDFNTQRFEFLSSGCPAVKCVIKCGFDLK